MCLKCVFVLGMCLLHGQWNKESTGYYFVVKKEANTKRKRKGNIRERSGRQMSLHVSE